MLIDDLLDLSALVQLEGGVLDSCHRHLQHARQLALQLDVESRADVVLELLPELVVIGNAEIIVRVDEDDAEQVGVRVVDVVQLGLDCRLLPAGVVVENEVLIGEVPFSAGLSYTVEGLQDLGERVVALGVEAVGEANPNVVVL